MTQKNKLIVGGVAVALVVYYLYDQNKKKKEVEQLKAGADEVVVGAVAIPLVATEVSTSTISKISEEEKKQLNFAGSRSKSMNAQYFR
jgi:hypothetical protein